MKCLPRHGRVNSFPTSRGQRYRKRMQEVSLRLKAIAQAIGLQGRLLKHHGNRQEKGQPVLSLLSNRLICALERVQVVFHQILH